MFALGFGLVPAGQGVPAGFMPGCWAPELDALPAAEPALEFGGLLAGLCVLTHGALLFGGWLVGCVVPAAGVVGVGAAWVGVGTSVVV